ncbi:GH92 family glycosyl hydrolase [Amycolatopsis nigrescens]|uniref:GH92 family glycosyl hydrolase n=1 Tax=Amycolatopsis nigrescens TaxID=381445 RepID=UPI001FE0CB88|nr:GH92 family glycosyl hydrolase [Amycolatopsis nigrescens]
MTVLVATVASAPTAAADPEPADDLAGSVNPFIGTTNAGNVYPGAVRPFGMLSFSPTTTKGDQTSAGAAGGYQYDVTRIRGFGLTHLNGTGCTPGASGDIPIMPFAGEVNSSPSADVKDQRYASDFSHAEESAEPGHYRIGLASGVGVDLTATDRTGSGRFTFPDGQPANLLFRTSNSLAGSGNAEVRIDPSGRRVTGSVDGGGFCGKTSGGEFNQRAYYRVHFVAEFDQPITGYGTWVDGKLQPGSTAATGGEGFTPEQRKGKGSGGYVGFETGPDRAVGMRVGISYVSQTGAEANLRAENPAGTSFDAVRADARQAWERALSRIQVGGGSPAQRRVFYTALYHALLQPSLFNDVTGEYLGSDLRTYRLSPGQHAQYSTFSGWDVYRAQVQLLALLEPRIAGDYAQSLLNFADQRGGEWDRWLHNNGKTAVMSGDPSAPSVAGMYAFGATNFDVRRAYASLVQAATVPTANDLSDQGCPVQCVGQRPSLDRYQRIGYVPSDDCHCWGGAAETLEDATADYAIAELAKQLGDKENQQTFGERAGNWRNVFDPKAAGLDGLDGYARNRASDGTWAPDFSPGTDEGFVEGTSAQYTWMVYHDMSGLTEAMGGRERAARRLDGFFHRPDGSWDLTGKDPTRFDAGNEPSIQTPWLYNYLGRPYRTQETLREIVRTLWTDGTGGIPGNDDLGTMSSWYVWTALGLYPQNPSRAELVLSAPLFPRAEIHRDGGRNIVVTAPTAAENTKYLHGLRVNGKLSTRPWVPDSLVRDGGQLDFDLATTPDQAWGSSPSDAPPG